MGAHRIDGEVIKIVHRTPKGEGLHRALLLGSGLVWRSVSGYSLGRTVYTTLLSERGVVQSVDSEEGGCKQHC